MSFLADPAVQITRKEKWDWGAHFPRMLELYNGGRTIPEIHVAIQTQNFTPCLRAVYNKFEKEGYSTGHGRHSESYCCGSLAEVEESGQAIYPQTFEVAEPERVIPRASICVPTGHTQMAALNVTGMQTNSTPSHKLIHDTACGFLNPLQIHGETNGQRFTAPGALDIVLAPENSKTFRNLEPQQQMFSYVPKQDIVRRNIRDAALIPGHSGGRTRHRTRPKEITGGATQFRRLRKLRSFTPFQPKKNNVSKSWLNQIPSLANQDSGHSSSREAISGHGTPTPSTQYNRDSGYYSVSSRGASSTLYFGDSLMSQGEPLIEIQGPYRVDCQTLHEAAFPGESRLIKPCKTCGYSNIHNLGWKASSLSISEFEKELRTERVYNLKALDATGNSALHYAAASGASYAHLEALIVAGVSPCQQNAAKQNFLHCLQPSYTRTSDWNPEYFEVSIIRLLDLLEEKRIFGQQDNHGQTVLHALTLHIIDPELKKQVITKFTQSGFPPTVLNRFGSCAISDDSLWRTDIVDFPSDPASVSTPLLDFEVLSTEWGDNLYNVILQAYDDPRSFDSKTRDTVLHSLSRVNVELSRSIQSGDMIKWLQDFVTKGVNRNWHNAEGHTPLTAFICNKELKGSVSGVALAKYIDILLGKDCKISRYNEVNVDMMNRRGATALYEAAIRGQSHSVRSLIEAGANPNARLNNDPNEPSILKATLSERDIISAGDPVCHHMFEDVVSYLEYAGAVENPNSFDERQVRSTRSV